MIFPADICILPGICYNREVKWIFRGDRYLNCAEVFDYRSTCIKCKFGVVIAVIFFMIFMCGCTDVNGTIPSEKEVLEEVKSICTSEEFELVSCVDVSDGTPPACMEYTFVTKERGLEFTARSTLRKNYAISRSAWYSKVVICDYEEVVKSLYINDAKFEIQECPLYYWKDGCFYISSFAQIETVAQSLAAAQEFYRQELQYNSEEFLRENYLFSVKIYGVDDLAADCLSGTDIMSYVKSDSFSRQNVSFITGMHVDIMQYDEIYDVLAMAVTDAYMDRAIHLEDEIPQKYIERWQQIQAGTEE